VMPLIRLADWVGLVVWVVREGVAIVVRSCREVVGSECGA
jgi:hypothetical protein